MWLLEPFERRRESAATDVALGAVVGLAAGLLISRALPRRSRLSQEIGGAALSVARRLRPARLHRLAADQELLDELEDAVLNRFLGDSVLRERAIDIGAISQGIVELSGSVRNEAEADRAVTLANAVPGVTTVVNRLEIEGVTRRNAGLRRPLERDELNATFEHQEGRVGGMGRRRQSPVTEPERPDDAQKLREEALAAADREQWEDEGFANRAARSDAHPEGAPGPRLNFREDELDNQDPHGKHAAYTLDSQPQALNPSSRVGEPPKPGIARQLNDSEIPLDEGTERDRAD